MDMNLSPEDAAFRKEVRAFIAKKLPPEIKRKIEKGVKPAKEDFVRWQKILFEKGWIAPNWPKEHGGTGWTPMQRHIFDQVTVIAKRIFREHVVVTCQRERRLIEGALLRDDHDFR